MLFKFMHKTILSLLGCVALALPLWAAEDPLQWSNPILPQRADPHAMLHTDGWYYFTATVPEYDRIELRRAKTLGGLSTAEPKVIWRKHARGPMSHHIWAPEIHFINGKWYIHFAAGRAESIWHIRPYVLENSSANPLEGEWVEKGEIKLNWDSFSLDATTFEHRGTRYLVWAQNAPPEPGTALFIAKMDTPWSIVGTQVCITKPELPWERIGHNVNEGAAVLHRNGRFFLTYSASATDANYCLGLLTADENADLLNPKSWVKSPTPVFKSNPATSQYGPGHNSFTTTPDGKTDIMVYHARNYEQIQGEPLHNPDRATRAQVVNWTADGTPNFGVPVADTAPPPTKIKVDTDQSGKAISRDLIGIFFEDINYAADGGLYAELVQNRSFEYSPVERNEWNPLTAWEEVARDGARGSLKITDAVPVHPNNPHYLVVETTEPGGGFGLMNNGFDGIVVRAGDKYDFSIIARQLFTGARWGGSGRLDQAAQLLVRLETKSGELIAEQKLEIVGRDWKRFAATLTPAKSDDAARLVVLSQTRGGIALDMVSLFPQKTFKNRPNGLRADLAQSIADLKPKFVRFPGGCLVHGYGLGNLYRWQDTVGPVEQRRAQPNIWGYHQTMGLGYFEYFQFCADIGAIPLPVVAAGVCCQNADHQGGTGQRGIPLDEMPAYIQEVLNLIEWANGPATSKWGAVRAAAGRPEPFNLKYLGVGNEDHITPVFRERFQMLFDAIKAKHPEIVVVGTVGPAPDGPDFVNGWKIADELNIPMVDEHYYQSPQWFWNNLQRYDSYDRTKSKVYLGEYAAHDTGRRTTLRSALAEAAFLTSLERNADIVPFASYAPLLGKRGHTQWNPNLIYFSNTEVAPTINYHVQQLFSVHGGDVYLSSEVKQPESARRPDNFPGVFLATWNTQVEIDNVRITHNSRDLANETFDSGAANWRAESGTWTVRDGTYRQTANTEPAIARLTTVAGAGDYTINLRARKTGGAEGFLIGFRAADAANFYWWNLGGWNNTRDGVEKSSGGTKSLVGGDRAGGIELNRWYDLRIEAVGNRGRCYLDGVLRHEFTDVGFAPAPNFAVSTVRDSQSGDLIFKVVNGAATPKPLQIELVGKTRWSSQAQKIVLTHADPTIVNDFTAPRSVVPQTESLTFGETREYTAPAHSFTVLRFKSARASGN
jgi:GH43 family beta-xylosidase/alpha-L-arabinofuranosidase